ncbi:SGNH hydrolase [Gloeopeniophorella convolvens]|nr:SGNH hydrolase [Gloeopeniophorella convolvens]
MAANYQDAIVLFGDSLTQMSWDPELGGVGARLANLYVRKVDVLNRGFSGYNTDWALPVLEQIIAKREQQPHVPRVRLLTIWFGANDACLPGCGQHVPLVRFSENLAKMVHTIREPKSPWYSPETKIILITAPPIHAGSFDEDNPTRTFDNTRSYAEAAKKAGENESVPVLDAWTRVWEAAGKDREAVKFFLTDGLHLNEAGYKIVYDGLVEAIGEYYPEIHHERLKPVFPLWDYFHDHTLEDFKAEKWVDR